MIENEKSNFAEDIGIIISLAFENKNNRQPKKIHPRDDGYDILSIDSLGKERCIEVKGSTMADPSIIITANEFTALIEKIENYFVYIIKNALIEPELVILNAQNVLSIEKKDIRLPYSNWYYLENNNKYTLNDIIDN